MSGSLRRLIIKDFLVRRCYILKGFEKFNCIINLTIFKIVVLNIISLNPIKITKFQQNFPQISLKKYFTCFI